MAALPDTKRCELCGASLRDGEDSCRTCKYDLSKVDFWAALDLHEERQCKSGESTYEIFSFDDGRVLTVASPKLSFRERLRALFGRPVQFHFTEEWTAIVADEYDESLSEAEQKARRRWLLQHDPTQSAPPKKIPTPKEQGQAALKLVEAMERKHNPDLIEAIKSLPAADTLVVKLPRGVNLTQADRKRLESVVKRLAKGESVQAKVAL